MEDVLHLIALCLLCWPPIAHAAGWPTILWIVVTDWIATTKHPRFHQPYADLVDQPMLEVLAHLRAKDFKTPQRPNRISLVASSVH